MIDDFLRFVRDCIYQYTGLPVVDTDDHNDRPAYPYFSYKVTSYIPDRHTGIHTQADSGQDVAEGLILQPTLALSFNAYDRTVSKSYDLALQAWEWFKHIGYHELKANNYVVTDVTAIYDRTVALTDTHEYRHGFDVMVRLTHTIERITPNIETWTINKEE